jgi:hypothetical protein
MGGAVLLKVINKMHDYLLWKMYKFEALRGMDEIFLVEKKGQPSNVSGILVTSKFKFEHMKKFILETYSTMPR